MADDSKVLVRLRLLGAQVFGRDAAKAGEGLDKLGRSGKGAGRGLGQAGRESTRTASAVTRVQGASKRAASGLNTMRDSASSVISPMTRAASAAAAVAGLGFGAAIGSSVNFEQAMAKVQSRLLLTKGAMAPLSKLAVDLGAKTNYSASEAAGAMDELASQGFNANQILKVLPGTLSLAAASGADLSQAAAVQTETLHAFSLKGSQASMVADVLAQTSNKTAADITDLQEALKYIAPVAQSMGQSLTDTTAAVGLLANVGIKGSQAGTTLRTAMVRLSKPTDKARDAMATLHLKAGDLVGKKGLLSLPNILGKVAKGSQGVSKNQRNAALATIFGREALSGMIKLVSGGPGKLKKLSDALEHSRGAAKRAATIQRDTVASAFDNLKGSVESASISLTKKYMPAIKNALNVGAGGITDFTKGLTGGGAAPKRQVVRGPGGRVEQVKTTPTSGAQKAGAGVGGVIKSVIAGAGALARQALPVLADAGRQLIAAIKPAVPFLSNVVLPLLIGIGKGVLGSVVAAFKVAIPIIRIVATALGFVGKLAKPLRPIIEGIGVVIGFVFSGPILKAVGALGKLGGVFRLVGGAARILRVPIDLVGGAFRGVTRVIGLLAGGFARAFTFVSRFAGTLSGAGRRVAVGAVNMIGGVIHAVETLPGRVAALAARVGGRLISGVANSVRSRLGSMVSFFGRVGSAMVRGIVEAVKRAPQAILSAIGWVVNQLPIPGFVKGKVKDVIGVHAAGGVVRRPLQVVGERGPELAALPMGTRVFNAGQTRQMVRPGGRAAPTMAAAPIVIHVHPADVRIGDRDVHQAHARAERKVMAAR